MPRLLCDYCEKEAKYIWWADEEKYDWTTGVGPRPVMYVLCEDHGSNMYPRVKIRIEEGGD